MKSTPSLMAKSMSSQSCNSHSKFQTRSYQAEQGPVGKSIGNGTIASLWELAQDPIVIGCCMAPEKVTSCHNGH